MGRQWHLGFFAPEYLPAARGFDESSGIYNAKADHYSHVIDDAYDWHVDSVTKLTAAGGYSGELVRNETVEFLGRMAVAGSREPWFAYVAFQEVHSPLQVDPKYTALYPELAGDAAMQTLFGMVTHTDDMVRDILSELERHHYLENLVSAARSMLKQLPLFIPAQLLEGARPRVLSLSR